MYLPCWLKPKCILNLPCSITKKKKKWNCFHGGTWDLGITYICVSGPLSLKIALIPFEMRALIFRLTHFLKPICPKDYFKNFWVFFCCCCSVICSDHDKTELPAYCGFSSAQHRPPNPSAFCLSSCLWLSLFHPISVQVRAKALEPCMAAALEITFCTNKTVLFEWISALLDFQTLPAL